ncbi:hypothetical protein FVE85_2554 [Porphyridium purpureum]|uniref:Uncharacterized protein n=1 Tax=Porphyridium purpureum TaxID=35688 RepID=A0A5J4YJH7_PORPP|nr:hypothetical protein FVE85_2554 [Porphyridium purpureum]|eukprot:POR8480..scf291_13
MSGDGRMKVTSVSGAAAAIDDALKSLAGALQKEYAHRTDATFLHLIAEERALARRRSRVDAIFGEQENADDHEAAQSDGFPREGAAAAAAAAAAARIVNVGAVSSLVSFPVTQVQRTALVKSLDSALPDHVRGALGTLNLLCAGDPTWHGREIFVDQFPGLVGALVRLVLAHLSTAEQLEDDDEEAHTTEALDRPAKRLRSSVVQMACVDIQLPASHAEVTSSETRLFARVAINVLRSLSFTEHNARVCARHGGLVRALTRVAVLPQHRVPWAQDALETLVNIVPYVSNAPAPLVGFARAATASSMSAAASGTGLGRPPVPKASSGHASTQGTMCPGRELLSLATAILQTTQTEESSNVARVTAACSVLAHLAIKMDRDEAVFVASLDENVRALSRLLFHRSATLASAALLALCNLSTLDYHERVRIVHGVPEVVPRLISLLYHEAHTILVALTLQNLSEAPANHAALLAYEDELAQLALEKFAAAETIGAVLRELHTIED